MKINRNASKTIDHKWITLRNYVFSVYRRQCMKCKSFDRIIQVDHIKPVSLHPYLKYSIRNLQILCKECNQEKLHFNSKDYRTFDDKRRMEEFIERNKNNGGLKKFVIGEKLWFPEINQENF